MRMNSLALRRVGDKPGGRYLCESAVVRKLIRLPLTRSERKTNLTLVES